MKLYKILVFDTNYERNVMIKDSFFDNECEIIRAFTLEECIEAVENFEYDLVIIEPIFTGNNKSESWNKIINTTQNSRTPILFICSEDGNFILDNEFATGDIKLITNLDQNDKLTLRVMNLKQLIRSREELRNLNQILEEKVAERTKELGASLEILAKAKKDLEAISLMRSQLLNLMSHEIRTPLNGIIGSLTLLGQYNFPDEIRTYFNLLDVSVRRLEEFAYSVLESSKLRLYGKSGLNISKFDLIEIINQTLQTSIEKYSLKEIKYKIVTETSKINISADSKFISKCFNYIFDNAYKFSPTKSTITIEIIDKNDETIEIKISDSGPGFTKTSLEYMFQPLNNLVAHVDKNNGMGLYKAKLIVDAHLGTITVGNCEPGGAMVTICLPKK